MQADLASTIAKPHDIAVGYAEARRIGGFDHHLGPALALVGALGFAKG
jgi:hypothetical protein